jgi:hypothetical protein
MIMKNQSKLFFLSFLLLINFSIPAFAANTFHNISSAVYFSSGGGCREAIVNEISHAKTEIYVQAYSFTSAPIANALVDAKRTLFSEFYVSPLSKDKSGCDSSCPVKEKS